MDEGAKLTKKIALDQHKSEEKAMEQITVLISTQLALCFPEDEFKTAATPAGLTISSGAFVGQVTMDIAEDMVLKDGKWIPQKVLQLTARRQHRAIATSLSERTAMNNQEPPDLFQARKAQFFWDFYVGIKRLFAGRRVNQAFEDASDDPDFEEADGRWQAFVVGLEDLLNRSEAGCPTGQA